MTAWTDPVEADLLDEPIQELYATYWVRFSSDFEGSSHTNKLPGPMNYFEDWSETDENGDGHGGDPATGYGWSARAGFKDTDSDRIRIGSYVYHMDMDGQYGNNWGYRWVSKGEWHRITQHVKMNTVSNGSANSDGILEYWVDDEKTIEQDEVRWTEHPEEGINYAFTVWYGGSDPSPKDQDVYLDNWKLSTTPIPGTPPEQDADPEGIILELITSEGMATTEYEFTVAGTVEKRTDAGDLSAEDNDDITDNGDGTVTVNGAVGNGYGDSYYVDGTIESMSDLDESKWTIRYDDEEVSIDDIVESDGPDIDRFEISKSQQLGDDRMFSVQWAVSENEDELDTVEVVVAEDEENMNFAVTDVSGESASGWDLFQFPVDTGLEVTLRAEDGGENVTTQTETITL
ncbi:polysaccharide lyase (plasmid) [Halorussus salilacus]|uniref:polysaccharide lyase n=1 Tax=Halorussus salilacus TaxID=2953750 RepID=UPI00209D8D0C|nr:polysaccharide lyase [Halorussus salilacus]USZ69747.1 polysaccharide lyase [Halorussus salilacus]